METGKYRIILLVVALVLLVCGNRTNMYSGSAAQKIQEEKSQETTVISKNDVEIEKKTYRYIEYEIIRPDAIRLRYIIPQEDLLVIPSMIDGYKVEELGKDMESDVNGRYVTLTKGQKVKKIIIGKGIKTIKPYTFYEAKVEEVVLPKSMKYIEMSAFVGCTLKKINLDSVEKIGQGAFLGCEHLKKIRLKNEKIFVEPNTYLHCRQYVYRV